MELQTHQLNGLRYPLTLERLVGDSIRHRWMNEEAMTRLRAEAIAKLQNALGSTDATKGKLKAAIKRKADQITRVVNAIVDAGHNPALIAKLAQLETEARGLDAELADLEAAAAPAPAEITDDIEAKIIAAANEIENLISRPTHPDAPRLREMVRGMIERITIVRHESGAIEVGVRGAFAGVMEAAGLVERHSLARALGREKAPVAGATGADEEHLSVVAGARNCLDLLLVG